MWLPLQLRLGASGTVIEATADGKIKLAKQAGSDFALLQFGGETNAYPALKRSGIQIHARRADDSAYAGFYAQSGWFANNVTAGASYYCLFNNSTRISAPSDGDLLLTNYAGNSFNKICLGGNSDSFPAIKRSGAAVQIVKASSDASAGLTALDFTAGGGYKTGGPGGYYSVYGRWKLEGGGSDGSAVLRDSGDSADAGLRVGQLEVSSPNPPASAGAAGTAGQVEWDSDYVYVCVATNTWKRAQLTTWT